jgi:hypothetical protein
VTDVSAGPEGGEISCATGGFCAAGGFYTDGSGLKQAFVTAP